MLRMPGTERTSHAKQMLNNDKTESLKFDTTNVMLMCLTKIVTYSH